LVSLLRFSLFIALLPGAFSLPLTAQHLQGRLLDVDSNEPVTAGILTLLSADSIEVLTVVSDQNGQWALTPPGPGVYFLRARRLGYQPWIAGPVEVAAGDELTWTYHLRRLAVRLDPLEVSAAATRRYLELAGFYDRQRSDFGHFITLEDIQRRKGSRVTDLLSGVPGVNLVPATQGGAGGMEVQLRGSYLSKGGQCRPRIYVDGLIYARGDSRPTGMDDWGNPERNLEQNEANLNRIISGARIDDIAHPETLAAIEIYRSGAQVPVQFGGTSVETLCGVIVIWTRTGRMQPQNQ
jgi:hypothetical protein